MDDREIVALFEARDERTLGETKEKYGRYIRSVALRILGSKSDAEECENDVYLRARNSIPPQKPEAEKRSNTRGISSTPKRSPTAKKRWS